MAVELYLYNVFNIKEEVTLGPFDKVHFNEGFLYTYKDHMWNPTVKFNKEKGIWVHQDKEYTDFIVK